MIQKKHNQNGYIKHHKNIIIKMNQMKRNYRKRKKIKKTKNMKKVKVNQMMMMNLKMEEKYH